MWGVLVSALKRAVQISVEICYSRGFVQFFEWKWSLGCFEVCDGVVHFLVDFVDGVLIQMDWSRKLRIFVFVVIFLNRWEFVVGLEQLEFVRDWLVVDFVDADLDDKSVEEFVEMILDLRTFG